MSSPKSQVNNRRKSKPPINVHRHPSRRPRERTVARRNGRVEEYKALVRPIAAFYAGCTPEPFDDLLQVGLMGLMRAAELFCVDHTAPFEAFAKPHIRGAILHYLRDSAPLIRLPRRVAELQQRANRKLYQGPSRERLTNKQLRSIDELKAWQQPISLDQLPLDEINMASPTQENPGIQDRDSALAVEALQVLDSQSLWIVGKVVLEGWSYRRAASQLQVSPMTVQRRLKQGLARVRSALEQKQATQGSSWRPARFAAGGC
jgi:RNA polymerase sigma-B factor